MLNAAIRAAREAGRVLLQGLESDLEVHGRVRHDVKLEMDRRSEETIVGILREAYPEHDVLTEEAGRIGAGSEYQWVVDPLDGTYNYFRRIPLWVTSIGLCRCGEEVLGVIYDPSRDEMFYAEKGGGAFLNGERINVSGVGSVAEATIGLAYGTHDEFMDTMVESMVRVARCADKMRGLGAAAMHLAYVACGRLDAFFEYGLWPWDVTAGMVLIREAGGRLSTRRHTNGLVEILSSNGRVHDELAEHIAWDKA